MVNLSNGHILLSPPLPTPLQHQSACKGIATLSAHYPHDSPTICERYSFWQHLWLQLRIIRIHRFSANLTPLNLLTLGKMKVNFPFALA